MSKHFPLQLGDAGQYELSEESLVHIVSGDTAIRPITTPTGKIQETVLSGGLHTYDGWKKFLALHPNVVHLMEFRLGINDAWWFARELQNGVITLRIPRSMFTKNAAGITQQPDNYYKSGYLWKTLFPVTYSEDDIVDAIGEALKNLDRELSDTITPEKPDGVLYGYAALNDLFTAMLIRIQVRGNQILSAFPAWDQPLTGNNGKPYSHIHSISFMIAESVVDIASFSPAYGPVFQGDRFDSEALLASTPQFIKSRRRRNLAIPVDFRNAARAETLANFAEFATPADLELIERYLADYPCAKDPFSVQNGMYRHLVDDIDRWAELYNASQVTENIGECLWVLSYCDAKFNTRRVVGAIVRFLGQALVHTGGLNTLMFKALIGDMITTAIVHNDSTALRDVLAAVATSPCRAALYTEFDLHPFLPFRPDDKPDDSGASEIPELQFNVEHLLEFIAFNLGENYLIGFSKERRLAFAREVLDHEKQWRMARDVMAKFAERDFDFLPDVLDLTKLTTQVPPAEQDLLTIARDYGRMMVMMRQRVVMEDPAAYKAKLEDLERGTEAYSALYRQQHKRLYVMYMHVRMLTQAKAYAETVGYDKLKTACEDALARLPKERIPVPRPVPSYIARYQMNEAGRVVLVPELGDAADQSKTSLDDDLEDLGE
jgi:hypothetical protein